MVQSFNTNVDKVGYCFIQKLDVKVIKSSFLKSIRENQFFPSLYSLSSTLKRFGVDNMSLKIENNKLGELAPPFIGLFENENGVEDFILIESVGDDVIYKLDGRKRIKSTRDFFFKRIQKYSFTRGNRRSQRRKRISYNPEKRTSK